MWRIGCGLVILAGPTLLHATSPMASKRPTLPAPTASSAFWSKPTPWVELSLTLPLFLFYQVGVITLDIRNGTDLVTGPLMRLSEGNRTTYWLITAGIGAALALVLGILGRGQAFRLSKFLQIAVEGTVYALILRFAGGWVDQQLFLGAKVGSEMSRWSGLVMSMGAGFYEELFFRVGLFGGGALLIGYWAGSNASGAPSSSGSRGKHVRYWLLSSVWAVVCAAVFSGVHYVGSMGDPFELRSFTFRFVLGGLLTLIYVTRGFAAAVWAHAFYDVWVLVLR